MDTSTKNQTLSPTTTLTAAGLPVTHAASNVPTTSEAEEAFLATEGEMDALHDDEVLPLNTDPRFAVTTGYGAIPKIDAMREEIRMRALASDIVRITELRRYLLALQYVQAKCEMAGARTDALPAIYDRALTVRESLLGDAERLAERGLLDKKRVAGVNPQTGYRNVAFALTALVEHFRENWGAVDQKCAVTPGELVEAAALATKLLGAIGERDQAPAVMAELSAKRMRAFTLFAGAYDEARRAITYLRPRGEADRIAPTIYSGRGAARRRDKPDELEASDVATAPGIAAESLGSFGPSILTGVAAATASNATTTHARSLFGAMPVAGSSSASYRSDEV